MGVGEGEGVVHKWAVGNSAVDTWDDSVDNWGVDSSGVVDNWSLGNSLDNRNSVDSSLDDWDIVDTGDGDLGVDEAAQQGRAGNIAGHWVVDSGGGVEKSGVSLGLGLSISRSLSIVCVWVSISIAS